MTETQHGNETTNGHRPPANIVWIASYPRSGNTWIRVFLWYLLRPMGEPEENFDFLGGFAAKDSSHVDLFERFLGRPPAEAPYPEIATVRPEVQAAIAEASNGVTAVKTHSALGLAEGASTIDLSLTAAAVYVVRNPLDVAVSLSAYFGTSIDVAIDRMCLDNCIGSTDEGGIPEFWGSWSQNIGSWTGSPNPIIMPVRYEDMMSAPELVFPAVAKFLNLHPSDEQMALARHASSFKHLKEMEQQVGFPETFGEGQPFFRAGRAGAWREILSEDQIRRLVGAHHVQMGRVGYLTPDLMQYVPENAR